jgi:hypothetical protein
MHNNVVSPRSLDIVFKRIDFTIQKRLAVHNLLSIYIPFKCNYFTHIFIIFLSLLFIVTINRKFDFLERKS